MFRAIWEFAQSQDCAAHSQNPEIACQSRDCELVYAISRLRGTGVQSRDCALGLRNLKVARHQCAISRSHDTGA